MSEWIDAPKDDIEINGEDVDILIESNNFGNRYVTVKLSDLKELIKEYDNRELEIEIESRR